MTQFRYKSTLDVDFGHDVPEEGKEARGDKDPVESDRVALPEPLLLELWLMEANAKGRVPEIYCAN